MESSPADTNWVPSLWPVATPGSAFCLSAASAAVPRPDYPAQRPLRDPLVQAFQIWPCISISSSMFCSVKGISWGKGGGGVGGAAGSSLEGVTPTKTWLQSLRGRMCWLTGLSPRTFQSSGPALKMQIAKYLCYLAFFFMPSMNWEGDPLVVLHPCGWLLEMVI